MREELLQLLNDSITSTFKVDQFLFEISRPEALEHGLYTTNAAFLLAKQEKKSPVAVAEQLVEYINSLKNEAETENTIINNLKKKHSNILQAIDRLVIEKPGFINIFFKFEAISREINEVLKSKNIVRTSYNSKDLTQPDKTTKKKIIIEFTDPNPFKELHIGHVYSNAVGESISRIFEAINMDVRRACYQGDVGMHVAKALWGMKALLSEHTQTVESIESLTLDERVTWMGKAYALGAQAFESDERAKQSMMELNILSFIAAQAIHIREKGLKPSIDYLTLRKTFEYDAQEIATLYEKGRAWSLEYFESRYKRLGTTFEAYYFESFVAERGLSIVKDHIQDGIFTEDAGAVVYKGEKHGLHTRVFVNALGLPTYEAKELGLAPTKFEEWTYDQSIIVTAKEINEYFKVLLSAMGEVSPELAQKTTHISHGVVRLPEGKMSSRTGNVKTADWLFEIIQEKIANILESNSTKYSDIDKKDIIEKATVATLKYSLLKVGLPADITFDLDASVSFDGDSGPYLLYTYARTQSILTKVSEEQSQYMPTDSNTVPPLTIEEHRLLRHISYFPEFIAESAKELSPSIIARYVTDLAQYFNTFYAKHSILGTKKVDGEEVLDPAISSFRLFLTSATAHTLKKGLHVLGIETVDKM